MRRTACVVSGGRTFRSYVFFFPPDNPALFAAGDAQLDAGADRAEHQPDNRHPSLPRRRVERIGHPDVAGGRRRERRRSPTSAIAPTIIVQAPPKPVPTMMKYAAGTWPPRRRQSPGTPPPEMRIAIAGGEHDVRDDRAERRADQRDADEVRGERMPAPMSRRRARR